MARDEEAAKAGTCLPVGPGGQTVYSGSVSRGYR